MKRKGVCVCEGFIFKARGGASLRKEKSRTHCFSKHTLTQLVDTISISETFTWEHWLTREHVFWKQTRIDLLPIVGCIHSARQSFLPGAHASGVTQVSQLHCLLNGRWNVSWLSKTLSFKTESSWQSVMIKLIIKIWKWNINPKLGTIKIINLPTRIFTLNYGQGHHWISFLSFKNQEMIAMPFFIKFQAIFLLAFFIWNWNSFPYKYFNAILPWAGRIHQKTVF